MYYLWDVVIIFFFFSTVGWFIHLLKNNDDQNDICNENKYIEYTHRPTRR